MKNVDVYRRLRTFNEHNDQFLAADLEFREGVAIQRLGGQGLKASNVYHS